MAEANLSKDVKSALDKFFDGKVTVYEAGLESERPQELTDRPFADLFPGTDALFLQAIEDQPEAFEIKAGEPVNNVVVDTEASKFIQSMEKRFNKVRPNQKLFVLDSDIVRGRYAADGSLNRSLEKSMIQFIKEKKEELDIEKDYPAAREGREHLIKAAFKDTSAFSRTQPGGVTEDNLEGNRYVSLIVGQNPDKLQKEWMVAVPGVPERMEKEGLTQDHMRRFTVYHEFGHALDPNSARGYTPYLTEANPEAQMVRYKKEAYADVHATLQAARDFDNTNLGELLSDIRINNTYSRVVKLQSPEGREALKSDLHKKLEKIEKENPAPENESSQSKEIRKLEMEKEEFSVVERIGAHMAYHTTPIVDQAVKIANKGLKDGSLKKMSDKDVLDLSEKIVEDNAMSMEEMNKLRMAIYTGDKGNKDLVDIEKRVAVSDQRMPIPVEKIEEKRKADLEALKGMKEKSLKRTVGINVPADKAALLAKMPNLKEIRELKEFRRNLVDKIGEKGATTEGLLDIVHREKDQIRKHHGRTPDKQGERKLEILNDELLSKPDLYISKSIARKTVGETLDRTKTLDVKDFKGNDRVEAFFAFRKQSLVIGNKMANEAMNRESAGKTPAQMVEALNQEALSYNKSMICEKTAQKLAFDIRKDPATFTKLKKSNEKLASFVDQAAKHRHPEWMEDMHLAFGSTSKKQLMGLKKEISDQTRLGKAIDSLVEKYNNPTKPKDKAKDNKKASAKGGKKTPAKANQTAMKAIMDRKQKGG